MKHPLSSADNILTWLICYFHLSMWIDKVFRETKNITCFSFVPDSVEIILSPCNLSASIMNRKQILFYI